MKIFKNKNLSDLLHPPPPKKNPLIQKLLRAMFCQIKRFFGWRKNLTRNVSSLFLLITCFNEQNYAFWVHIQCA